MLWMLFLQFSALDDFWSSKNHCKIILYPMNFFIQSILYTHRISIFIPRLIPVIHWHRAGMAGRVGNINSVTIIECFSLPWYWNDVLTCRKKHVLSIGQLLKYWGEISTNLEGFYYFLWKSKNISSIPDSAHEPTAMKSFVYTMFFWFFSLTRMF